MSERAIVPPAAMRGDGVAVRYGRRTVLDGAALTVPRGAVYALLGRNGSGKSSLIRCLLGQQKPAAGHLQVLGLDPWSRRQELMARVGVVPETPDAPPEMTAAALSRFLARLNAKWDATGVADRLRRFDIPREVPFARLSKGQKGAVMLALALGHGPELLVMDDPTLGLDVVARHAVFGELISELADHGTTVLITTHDLAAIEGIADEVGFLVGGRVTAAGSMEALKARWERPLEQIFVAVTAGATEPEPRRAV